MNPTMNPQVQPNQPLQPAATQQSPQGVTSVAPTPPATPSQLPTAQTPTPPAAYQPSLANPTAGLQNIADYYQIPRQTALNVANTQQQEAGAGQRFAATKFQAGVSQQNLQDQLDPGKYKITQDPKSPNGIDITNSLGDKVDLGTYVNLTGDNPAKVLATSSDPAAQEFVQSYNNFQDLLQTTLAHSQNPNDQAAAVKLGDYYKANPGLENMTPDQVSKLFMERYGQYFGMPQAQSPQNTGTTQNFGSQNSPMASSPYYQMQNYSQLAQPNPITASLLGGGSGGSSTGTDYTSLINSLQQQGATPPAGG